MTVIYKNHDVENKTATIHMIDVNKLS